jgi:hypothetical protein
MNEPPKTESITIYANCENCKEKILENINELFKSGNKEKKGILRVTIELCGSE